MRIALAPIPFFWPAEQIRAFYEEIAATAVDIVYLGETVCYKRRGLRLDDWLALGAALVERGKEVVLSSLVLVDGEAEIKATRRLCANGRFPVEANDMSAVALSAGHPFIAGATLNIYNEDALAIMAGLGAARFVVPLELSGTGLSALRAAGPATIACEALAFGRPPLAYSARCFSARNADRGKDDCEWVCERDPEGLLVRTQEDDAFLTLNGLQIHAAQPTSYIDELPALCDARVDVLRIVPQRQGTATIIAAFRALLDGHCTPEEAHKRLQPYTGGHAANGYWWGAAGRTQVP